MLRKMRIWCEINFKKKQFYFTLDNIPNKHEN